MRAVLAVLCVLMGSGGAWGQFDIDRVYRRVRVKADELESYVTPHGLDDRLQLNNAFGYATIDAEADSMHIYAGSSLGGRGAAEAHTVFFAVFNVPIAVEVNVDFTATTGIIDGPTQDPIQLVGPVNLEWGDGAGLFYRRNLLLTPGEYTLSVNQEMDAGTSTRYARIVYAHIPEPATWLLALIAIHILYCLRRTPSHPAKGFSSP